jgi:hypothetical protein
MHFNRDSSLAEHSRGRMTGITKVDLNAELSRNEENLSLTDHQRERHVVGTHSHAGVHTRLQVAIRAAGK